MTASRLDLVFLWHMHQPDYRDRTTGEFVLPWTCLHALKDYTDMAGHLERHPKIRAVVNFVPVLLDQIDDYVAQFASGEFRDPLLRLLARPDSRPFAATERRFLLETCFRCNHATMLMPFPRYRRLHDLHESLAREGGAALDYLSDSYFTDLVTWYFLAWTGETERRREPLLAELMAKGEGFDPDDRRQLLAWIGRTLADLVPRYRVLQERGQVELSATPYSHPLGPLLLDFETARESLPEAPLPRARYPGGCERLDRHFATARDSHAARFGEPPVGMWPAEGGLSAAFVRLAAASGCRWLASGENVLRHSLAAASARAEGASGKTWQLPDAPGLTLFFRDDHLSDLIGFEYAKWHGRDAAAHFVARLEAIAAAAPAGETPVVSVILDGENAWETYPYNGYYFLDDLYTLLEAHPVVRTRTCASVIGDEGHAPALLPHLTAGSWVYGTFSTWIGDLAKNRAWELLCAAKQSYDRVVASGRLTGEEMAAAEALLTVCESSDWFWWFGDDNPAPTVTDFDRLFRRNLANLYRVLHLEPPSRLDAPVCRGGTESIERSGSGTMRRGSEHPAQAA